MDGSLSLEKINQLNGVLNDTNVKLSGIISNSILRGAQVQMQYNGNVIQWKYEDEDEWHDLVEISQMDYEEFENIPTVNGLPLVGDISNIVVTPDDTLSNTEIFEIFKD